MTIWIYSFDDGTEFKLLNIGFSIQEIIMLEKMHGACVISHERICEVMRNENYITGRNG